MDCAKFRIEIQHRAGDVPASVTLWDTTVSENQWASHYVLRGKAKVEFRVGGDGLESVVFIPHGAA